MLSNEELGMYLKNARNKKDLSLRKVNELTDISYSHLNMIENGKRNVTPALLRNLAKLYNLDYIDLYEKAGYIDLIAEEKIDRNIANFPQETYNSAIVLIYGTIPAGIPMECIEDIIDTEEIPTDMLKGGKQYFGLKIKGDSMEPDYLDGDIVIFQKQDTCENGEDCCVMVNGSDGTFKRVFKNENGIVLQPLNNKYEPLIFSNEQIEKLPVRILGIFEELRRKKRRK